MNGRTFVLIFCFWAFLTIITPTLVHLSASAKPNLDFKGEESDGLKARRMMGYLHKHGGSTPVAPAPAQAPVPGPAPVLAPELGDGENAFLERLSNTKIKIQESMRRCQGYPCLRIYTKKSPGFVEADSF